MFFFGPIRSKEENIPPTPPCSSKCWSVHTHVSEIQNFMGESGFWFWLFCLNDSVINFIIFHKNTRRRPTASYSEEETIRHKARYLEIKYFVMTGGDDCLSQSPWYSKHLVYFYSKIKKEHLKMLVECRWVSETKMLFVEILAKLSHCFFFLLSYRRCGSCVF